MSFNTKTAIVVASIYTVLLLLGLQNTRYSKYPSVIPLQDDRTIKEYIQSLEFKGEWKNLKSNSTIITHNSGRVTVAIFEHLSSLDVNTNYDGDIHWRAAVTLEDPRFYDLKIVQILQTVNKTEDENGFFNFNVVKNNKYFRFDTYQGYHFQRTGAATCDYEGSLVFDRSVFTDTGFNTTRLKEMDGAVALNFTAQNEGCDLQITSSLAVNNENVGFKHMLYAMFIVTIALINWFGAIRILHSITDNVNYTAKLNMWTLSGVTLQDSFIFLLHLNFGVGFINTFSFFLIFFLFFLLFALVDYRILLFTWRYQSFRVFDNLEEIQFRKKLYFFQLRIYALLILYNYVMWKFFLDKWLIFGNAFILLPQIIHNMCHPTSPDFDTNYAIYFTGFKYLIFYYIRGCPHNIFNIEFYYLLPTLGLGLLVLTISILYCQEAMGATFIIPKIFKPKQYDYLIDIKTYRKLKDAESSQTDESFFKDDSCPICLENLFDKDCATRQKESGDKLKVKIHRRKLKSIKPNYLMKAPCNHTFHPYCLLQWIEIKMECPCCRTVLPSIN